MHPLDFKKVQKISLYIHQSWQFNHPPNHLDPILQGWTFRGILKCRFISHQKTHSKTPSILEVQSHVLVLTSRLGNFGS